uniref:Uncharacterized protein n=1 Tax=Anopheles christyi TaxID=43041 RepID=A0A182KEW3_9DIPT
MSKVRRRDVLLIVFLVLELCLALDARRYGGSVRSIVRAAHQQAAKVKRESGNDGDKADSPDEVIYDQRQVNGETNIRLSIKNVQLQLPESELVRFQKSNMAQLIRNSVLRLLGLEMGDESEPEVTSRGPPVAMQPSTTEQQPNLSQSLPDLVASMLQVNGTNVPAKFFLEISDFLMNTNDNDAVDDMRVETNHNQQQQLEQQQLGQQLNRFQQQQQQQEHPDSPQQAAEGPLFGTEEITIERLENTSNVKNQTITISKKRHQVGPLPTDGSALETVSKENHQSTNTTRNATESSDRFVQTKPIRLETVRVTVTSAPQTLREKVIWKVPSVVAAEGSG